MDGIRHCHNNQITHKDLNPKNILINKKLQLTIADFGIADSIT